MNRIEDVYGLTPVQEGIYAGCFQNRETAAYQLSDLFELGEKADIGLIQDALRLLQMRHPVLRTAFVSVDGTVKQVILSDRSIKTGTVLFDAPYSPDALKAAVDAKRAEGFDLQRDPLAQCVFFLFKDRRFLLFRMHHLISDGWSANILFNDLTRFYARLAEGENALAIEAEIKAQMKTHTSFASYVNLIRSMNAEEARVYWKTLLSGASAGALPKAYPQTNDTVYGSDTAVVSAELLRRTERFAQENRVSVNTVFECAFALAMLKFSGGNEFIFNKVLSGKSVGLPAIESTAGPMINTVPVRACRYENMTLSAFLAEIRKQSLSANNYGFLPLADIYRLSGLDPRAVQVLFVFGNYSSEFRAAETQLLKHIEHREATEFALTVNLFYASDGCRMKCSYDNSRFSGSFVSALLNSFMEILTRLTSFDREKTEDASALRTLTDLTPDEYRAAVKDGNDTDTPFCSDTSVYALFEEQINKNAGSVITDGDKTYTLPRLNEDAAKIDEFIRGFTGGKKQAVGILCDRSYAELAAVFGVVRGGNAYLPISPEYPPERIRGILADAGCTIVLAQKQFMHLSPLARPIEEILGGTADTSLPPAAAPEDTLYVIYTSGSTGTPKGAMVSNRSAVNRIEWMAKRCFDADTVVMRKTPYTFDVSVWEIFGFAMFGFSLYILPPGQHYNQSAVLEHISAGHVTDLHFVPTVFEQFLSVLQRTPDAEQKLSSLRRVILSGESLQAKQVNLFRRFRNGRIGVLNLYGPAECAVDVTAYECGEAETDPVPIGKPIANTQIYILDAYMQPVPIGVTGEICIGGANVGQGYLNDPARTAQVFVDDPFSGGKLYKTGDIGYRREDGNIIFTGRRDHQVKLNGQRVELGEIEAALSALEGIESAAVLLKKDEAGQDVLCAYYTGSKTPGADLRALLSERLPRYMLPQAFRHMDALPLTSGGKTDRKALESIPAETETQAYEPPLNETEALICDAFSRILHTENVGRNADFYALGGTSMNMVQLLSTEPLSELEPASFMAAPTPAALAQKLLAKKAEHTSVLQPLYLPAKERRAFILFPYAGGDASAYVELVRELRNKNNDISIYYAGWQIAEDPSAAAGEISRLAAKTDVYFYSHCAGAVLAMKLLDILNAHSRTVKGYIAAGSIPPTKAPVSFNLWAYLPDKAILRALKNGGLNTDGIGRDRLGQMLSDFRSQTDLFAAYFCKKTEKTDVNTVLILSENDPFTPNHTNAKARWEAVVSHVERLILLQTPSHYFQNTDIPRITELFSEIQ